MDRERVFDTELLASRLIAVTAWLQREHALAGKRIAYFGAGTGAAAALIAAAEHPGRIFAS